MATNFLGPHLLLSLLAETLAASSPSRVVFVASSSEQVGSVAAMDNLTYGVCMIIPNKSRLCTRGTHVHEPKLLRYGTTKLWTLMCVPEWQRRLGPAGVCVLACHPGLSKSSIFAKFSPVSHTLRFCALALAPWHPGRCSGPPVCSVGVDARTVASAGGKVDALLCHAAGGAGGGLCGPLVQLVVQPWAIAVQHGPPDARAPGCTQSGAVCTPV